MLLRDDAFEAYMRYDKPIRQFAESWAGCIELSIKGGMLPRQAIANAHNLITFGTDMTLAALQLLVQCWQYGAEIADWYDSIRLLVNI
jgi:hypothetical protein